MKRRILMKERSIGDKLDDFYALMMSQLKNKLTKEQSIESMKIKFEELFDGQIIIQGLGKVGMRFDKREE